MDFYTPRHLALSHILSYLDVSELVQVMMVSRTFYVTVQSLPYFEMFRQILEEKNIATVLQIIRARNYSERDLKEWKTLAYISDLGTVRKYFVGGSISKLYSNQKYCVGNISDSGQDFAHVIHSGSLYLIRLLLKRRFKYVLGCCRCFYTIWDRQFSDRQDEFLRQTLTEEQLYLLAKTEKATFGPYGNFGHIMYNKMYIMSTVQTLKVYIRICNPNADKMISVIDSKCMRIEDTRFLHHVFVGGITANTWLIYESEPSYILCLLKHFWNSLYDLLEQGFNLLLVWDTHFDHMDYQILIRDGFVIPERVREYIHTVEEKYPITDLKELDTWRDMKKRLLM